MTSALTFSTRAPAREAIDSGVIALVERARTAAKRQPIDEHRWDDALLGHDDSQSAVVGRRGEEVVGLGLVTADGDAWNIDVVVDPADRDDAALVESLMGRTVAHVAGGGGGEAQLWIHAARDTDERAAAAAGLPTRRDLHQLRVPLPLDVSAEPIATRPFVVGQDEDEWLAVNAAAFAEHPDQGHWTMDDLRAREAEPWFDPTGFLLHEADDGTGPRLAGFNWTKRHPDEDLGEIYVIGVHPDFAGRGLGRALCVAGLDHLANGASTGMLYVDDSNTAAMHLYRSLGFHVDHTNTAFGGRIEPAS